MTKELSDESEQIQISVSGFKFGEIALQKGGAV